MKHVITFGLCLLATVSHAQLLTPYLQGNSVKAFAFEEATDALWAATSGGLWQFEQSSFRQIPIAPHDGTPPPLVLESLIFAEYDGALRLIVASDTLGLYIKYDNTWKHLTSDSGLPSRRITALATDRLDRLWIGTPDQGVGVFDGASWHRIQRFTHEVFDADSLKWSIKNPLINNAGLPATAVHAIYEDKRGFIWIGTTNGAVRFNGDLQQTGAGQNWCRFLKDRGETVLAFQNDLAGGLWAGSLNNGIYKFEDRNCPFPGDAVKFPGVPANSAVRAITLDLEGNLWLATNQGVYIHNPQTGSLRTLTDSAIKFIHALLIDSDNNVWLGQSQTQGALRLNNNWLALDTRNFPTAFTSALHLSRDTLWVGTSGGLQRIKGEKIIGPVLLPERAISALLPDPNGNVWVSVFGECEGLYLFSKEGKPLDTIRVKPCPEQPANSCAALNDDRINALAQRGDTLWAATFKGLNRGILSQPDSCWRYYTTTSLPAGLGDNVIYALEFDSAGRLWCGTSAGVDILDPRAERWIPAAELDQGLAQVTNVSVIRRHPQTEEMWLGTADQGVYVYSRSGLAHFDRSTVLPDNFVTAIAFSSSDEIWIATRNGVARRDTQDVWSTFTQSSGLASNFVQTLALQGDSIRWFGTWGAGLTRYRPPQSLPQTFIDTRLDVTDKTEIIYYFNATDLNTAPSEFRFRYWVDKGDTSLPTSDHFAVINLTEPGPHTFYVQALDRDGNLDRTPASDTFYKIHPDTGQTTLATYYNVFGLDSVSVRLYWPPYQFSDNLMLSLAIEPVDTTALAPNALLAYDFQPDQIDIKQKGVILSFEFPAKESAESQFAVYQERDSLGQVTGIRLGGTPQKIEHGLIRISTRIDEFVRYSVRSEVRSATDSSPVPAAKVLVTPRLFSPLAGGHGQQTTLSFTLNRNANVRISVFNLAGRIVKIVWDESMSAGLQAVTWDGRDRDGRICPSGLYIMVVENAGNISPQKVMLLNETSPR